MYNSRITREHRTAFVLLCDMSGSMAENVDWRGQKVTKAYAVANIINRFIDELINRSRREDGVRDYFDIAVLEYSGSGVSPLLSPETDFISVAELIKRPVPAHTYTELRNLAGGNQILSTVTQRRWIEPRAEGNTPMGAALDAAGKLAAKWCARPANRESFPPMVINITDGEASDADHSELCALAERVCAVATDDGNTLLFNIHLAEAGDREPVLSFPSSIGELPHHRYVRLLYDMSSAVPECFNETVGGGRKGCAPPFRAMSFNCPIDELFSMLVIGSLSISLTA